MVGLYLRGKIDQNKESVTLATPTKTVNNRSAKMIDPEQTLSLLETAAADGKLSDTAVDNIRELLPYWTSPWLALDVSGVPQGQVANLRRSLDVRCRSGRLALEAHAAMWDEDLQSALELVDRAVELCPADTQARYRRALVWAVPAWDAIARGDREITQRRFRDLVEVIDEQADGVGGRPGLPPRYLTIPRLALARMLLAHGHRQEAERWAAQILEYEPQARVAQDVLVQAARGR